MERIEHYDWNDGWFFTPRYDPALLGPEIGGLDLEPVRLPHTVRLLPDTPLANLLQREVLPVNSYHHQAVRALAPGLAPMAVAPDGIVEAVYEPGRRFVWAVQWHPEFSWKADEASRRIFAAFVGAC